MGRRKAQKNLHSKGKKKKVLLDSCDSEINQSMKELKCESKVIKLSDGEDEIDDLLDEFIEKGMNESGDLKPNSVVKLTSDDEEEIDYLLEEFSKNVSDDNSSTLKISNNIKSSRKRKIKSKAK